MYDDELFQQFKFGAKGLQCCSTVLHFYSIDYNQYYIDIGLFIINYLFGTSSLL